MSTFLQLCQDTRRECGIAGTGPTAVTGQAGELERVVQWVKQAWIEIQNRHDNWRWMRVRFNLDTVADDDEYASGDATDVLTSTGITRFSKWRVNEYDNPAYIFLKSSGSDTETWLTFIDWNSFLWLYRRGAQNSGYPSHVSIDPQDNLVLGQKPDAVYTVTGTYQRSAQVLAADGDTPEMPSQFHDLITWMAAEKYGYHESAVEIISKARRYGGVLLTQLEANQLPPVPTAGPLA